MRPASLPCRPLPGPLLSVTVALASAAACRAPEGTPEAPEDTRDRPFVVERPLTPAEVARNERFQDLRRTRFEGSAPVGGTPIPASASRD